MTIARRLTASLQSLAPILLTVLLSLVLSGCGGSDRIPSDPTATTTEPSGTLAEAAPPLTIRQLQPAFANYQPQVAIASPTDGATLQDTRVEVQLEVSDLPIYKDETLNLGPHLHLYLDNQPPREIYDLEAPIVFEDLQPGTHTLRAFVVRPWQESFKNAGAYTQISFNIFTATPGSTPDPDLPLLTYSSPQGTYGAEPILLDFYLNNAPLHLVARDDPDDEIRDWRVRVTVNGESFNLEEWQPVYLKGFQTGTNWVKLELIDEEGLPIANVFNATARLIEYDPDLDDTLAQLARGELSADGARGLVDPDYQPPSTAESEAAPEALPESETAPEAVEEEAAESATESAKAETEPEPEPEPQSPPEAAEVETAGEPTEPSESDAAESPASEAVEEATAETTDQEPTPTAGNAEDEAAESATATGPSESSSEATTGATPADQSETAAPEPTPEPETLSATEETSDTEPAPPTTEATPDQTQPEAAASEVQETKPAPEAGAVGESAATATPESSPESAADTAATETPAVTQETSASKTSSAAPEAASSRDRLGRTFRRLRQRSQPADSTLPAPSSSQSPASTSG